MLAQAATALTGKGGDVWLMGVQCCDRKGMQVWSLAASPSPAFQFSYTAVFGAYTAFLFIRTGWSSVSHGSLGAWAHRSGWENGKTVLGATSCFNLSSWALGLVRSERWKEAEALVFGWMSWALISCSRG